MRAFIFSLDAFVAFTLALVAIYSLIFFSSVPSSYYYLLTQGHYLTRDILLSMSTSECTDDYGTCGLDGSVLDAIVSQADPDHQKNLIRNTVGEMVPNQFGYRLEVSEDEGENWAVVYDTADHNDDKHAKLSKKLSVSSQVISFGYSGKVSKMPYSPYNYLSCTGDGYGDGDGIGTGFDDWGLITCGELFSLGGEEKLLGNLHPSEVLGVSDLVPSTDAKVVRFTVYI